MQVMSVQEQEELDFYPELPGGDMKNEARLITEAEWAHEEQQRKEEIAAIAAECGISLEAAEIIFEDMLERARQDAEAAIAEASLGADGWPINWDESDKVPF